MKLIYKCTDSGKRIQYISDGKGSTEQHIVYFITAIPDPETKSFASGSVIQISFWDNPKIDVNDRIILDLHKG